MKFATSAATALYLVASSPSFVRGATADDPGTGSYANPCEEFGTAKILNELYYDVSPNCHHGKPSFYCSGMFFHGYDTFLGAGKEMFTPEDLTQVQQGGGKYVNQKASNFTVGISALASAACPAEIRENAEYPFWCPTEKGIAMGSVSFTYARADLRLPRSFLDEWKETNATTYYGNSPNPTKPTPVWSGPGLILMPETATNPNIQVPDGAATFWDENRVGSSWPSDGTSSARINCGSGLHIVQMSGLGDDSVPPIHVPDGVLMQCPPQTPAWIEFGAVPSGYEDYCPEFTSYQDYYDRLLARRNELADNAKNGKFNSSDAVLQWLVNFTLTGNTMHGLACGIPASKFDEVFIPAFTYKNFDDTSRREFYQDVPGPNMYGMPFKAETVLRSWHGMGFNQLARHMVFFADDQDGNVTEAERLALERAEQLYEASQIGGGPPISIPVVFLSQEEMFDAGDGSQPDIFRCVAATSTPSSSSGTTDGGGASLTLAETTNDPSSGAFSNSIYIPALLASIAIVAFI